MVAVNAGPLGPSCSPGRYWEWVEWLPGDVGSGGREAKSGPTSFLKEPRVGKRGLSACSQILPREYLVEMVL